MKKTVSKNILIVMLIAAAGIIVEFWTMLHAGIKEQVRLSELSDKHLSLYLLLNQWFKTKQEGKALAGYFHKNGIKSIAIYGMSYLGERLYTELRNSDIEIKYAIDKRSGKACAGLQTFSPDEDLPEVGAIVITAVFYFDEIKSSIEGKTVARIISLEDILYEI